MGGVIPSPEEIEIYIMEFAKKLGVSPSKKQPEDKKRTTLKHETV
jgi:hypothetical protein